MDSARRQPLTTTSPRGSAAGPAPEPSTGVMKALVLVDALREQRQAGDDARRASLMSRHRRS